MWVENESTRKDLLKKTSIEHNFANELLNFTDKQWQVTSKYHNLDNYNWATEIVTNKKNITNLGKNKKNFFSDIDWGFLEPKAPKNVQSKITTPVMPVGPINSAGIVGVRPETSSGFNPITAKNITPLEFKGAVFVELSSIK